MAYDSNRIINNLEAKTTPIDADSTVIGDSADSNRAKKTTWANIKATLKTYFDTIYSTIASPTFTGTVTTPAIIVSNETASTVASFDGSKNIKSLALATYPSLTELSYVKGVTSALQTQINAKAPSTSPTFATSVTGSYLTASEILITDGSKNIVSAPVATYPSLTELSYVKGVTSSIQTQLSSAGFKTIISRGDTGTGSAGNVRYGRVGGSETTLLDSGNEPYGTIVPFAGTVKNLYVRSGVASSTSDVYVIRKNGVDTSLTVTFSNEANTTKSDTVNSFTVVAGDRLTFSQTSTGTGNPTVTELSVQLSLV